MAHTVATSSRAAESSTPAIARPEPVPESSVSESVIPSVYMSTSDSLGMSTPNYSSIGDSQASYCESVSSEVSSSIPASSFESVTSSTSPESATTSASDATSSSESSEANSSEESPAEMSTAEAASSEGASAETESASSEESTEAESAEESTSGASAEGAEATGEDAVCSEEDADGESAHDETATTTPEVARRSGGDDEESKGIEAVVTKLPRRAPIRTPYVGSPPPQAIQRRDEIIKRTGSPPELHHAQVRQAAEHVAQAARDAQRRMVWQLGNIAKDTRISIEVMASEILKVTSAAVAEINAAIEVAISDVGMAAEDEADHIQTCGALTGDQLEQSRNDVTVQLTTYLTQGSADVEALNEVSRGRFDNFLGQAEAKIFAIPDTGAVGRIPAPPAPPAPPSHSTSSEPPPHVPQEGERTADYQIMSHARENLVSFIDTQSEAEASNIDGPHSDSRRYFTLRATPVLDGWSERRQTDLVNTAQENAENLSSDATRAQFNIMLLGLTTPISEHHANDESNTVDTNDQAMREQMTETEYATHQAVMTIYEKRDQAALYLDNDLRDNLTDNIRKTGRKAYKSLMEQAATAEVALNSSAAPMAEGYRDLVDRLNVLVPPGRFLDSRDVVPKMMAARDSAEKLRRTHEEVGNQQSLATIKQMQDVKKEQADGIAKAGQESANSVHDVVIQTSFDMSMFSSQMTGSLSEGAINGMAAAQGYAGKVAKGILDSIHGTEGSGLTRIDQVAVGFLNGNINAAEQAQFHMLSAFVEDMEQVEDGKLTNPMVKARDDLESRSTEIDNAMPARSTGTALGLGLVSPLALGVYLYHTDADESKVIQQLGNIMWPGVLAVEEVYRGQNHGYLRGNIEDRMSSPEKGQAIALFSSVASDRASARLEIADRSTHWYMGVNREARESVLQGMSGEERESLDPSSLAAMRAQITGNLSGTEGELSAAYIDGNREAAAAARTHEALNNAQRQGEWGWIFSAEAARERSDEARVDAMAHMDETLRSELTVETAFVDDDVIAAHRDQVFREFASLTDPSHRSASSFSLEEARGAMINYATRDHYSAVLGVNPLGLIAPPMGVDVSIQRVSMGDEARQYIEDVVNHGTNSKEARASRGVFEVTRADADSGGFGISSTTQVRLTDALENRDLEHLEREVREARTPEARSRAERLLAAERERHQERLRSMAVRLGAPEDISPADAETFMSNRVGGLFATTDTLGQRLGVSDSPSHSRYGEELITHGRASLDAGVALASDGLGTNDALLRSTYTDRSHADIAAANARWAAEHGGENMEEMLGIRQREWTNGDTALMLVSPAAWFATRGSETSGDLAMELEISARGNPETDADYVDLANLRYDQQRRRGTGFISSHTMSGSDEERYIDSSRDRMARTILTEAGRHNPELLTRFGNDPSRIFNPDGSIRSEVTKAAFNERGEFLGDSSLLHHQTRSIGYAADAYRAEIDRQEAMLMSGITIMALVVSLALMVVPGVNIVAAGMISALVAGALTIAVKAGMRGGRYGWEEAATDLAQTAIEVAAAGIGGGISRGFEEGVKVGRLARIGESLVARFGKVGGAVVREAMVGAVSTAAQTAIQDDIWSDGLSRGLGRVVNGAIRGAAVSAVTTIASEGVTHFLTVPRTDANGAKILSRAEALTGRVGPHASEIIREGLNNTVGAVAGETAGVLIDYGQGNFHGTFGDALRQIGTAGLRELITSTVRTHIMSTNRAHFEHLMDAAQRGGTLSDAEMHALRAFGISAGVFHPDQDIAHVRSEVLRGRVARNSGMLMQLPHNLREHLMTLDSKSLEHIVSMLEQGGNPLAHPQNLELIHSIAGKLSGLSAETLTNEFNNVMSSRRAGAESELDSVQQHQLRQQLGAQLHEEFRSALDGVAVDGLQHLSPEHLEHAAAMIQKGEFDFATADNLLRAAKAQNPNLDEFAFLHNLHNAVRSSQHAQETMLRGAIERRHELVDMVPREAAGVFAKLGDVEVLMAQRLINAGDAGTPQQRDSLYHAALEKSPNLTREQFHNFMETAAGRVRQQMETEHQARRSAREERMTHVPEELRGTLSALPESALAELRLRQMQGTLSPDDKVRLIMMAQRETPGVDIHILGAALEQAVKHTPTTTISDAQAADMRRHLLSAIPEELHSSIEQTRILVLPSDEFNALTRSQKGQAVTLIMNGEPVIVMREGANPHVLREEGIHAMQARDVNWKSHIGALDERTMAQWDSLPLEQQLALYGNKLALELDAQNHVIRSLEADIENTSNPTEKRALQQQLEQVLVAHQNLSRRQAEVGSLSDLDIHNMRAGFSERPQWLEQPARLFNKESETIHLSPEEQLEHASLLNRLTADLKSGGDADARWRAHAIEHLDLHSLRQLIELHPNPRTAREIFDHARASGNPKGFIEQAHRLASRTGAEATLEIIRTEQGRRLFTALAATGGTHSLDLIINHSNPKELSRTLLRLGAAPNPAALVGHLTNVLSLLSTNQSFEFLARLSQMEIANVPDHVEAFSHITNNINDPVQVQAFMHLVSRLNAGEYFDFVLKWGVISSTLFPQLEQNLPHFYQGKLLSRVIEMAATQHDWKAFFDSAHDLLSTMNRLPATPQNQEAVNHVMRYLLNPNGQAIHLAADVFSAVDQLCDPKNSREAIFALQVARLQSKTGRLVGSDGWQTHLETAALRWQVFSNDPTTKPFADFLAAHPSTQGWSDGQLGAIQGMHKWFEHLAELRGIKPDDHSDAANAARNALLTEVFNRGFDGSPHTLTSNGKLVDVNRAFREMVTEATTGIDLRNLAKTARSPERMASALKRAGITEENFAHFSDAEKETLLQHLHTLESRHGFYEAMKALEGRFGGGAHGIQQNITEVLGEIALAQHMVLHEPGFRLAIPFSKGTGFDQIWIGRGANGETVYIIGEAKGPNAELGSPGKGPQMSAEWVANTLREMLTSGSERERNLARDMIAAIRRSRAPGGGSSTPVIRGVIIEAGNPKNKAGEHTGADGYDFSAYDSILGGI